MAQQALGPEYARNATAQWTELIDSYQPPVLWNDGWTAESDPGGPGPRGEPPSTGWSTTAGPRPRCPRTAGPRPYLRFISLSLKALARVGLPPSGPRLPLRHPDPRVRHPDPAPTRPWELCRGLGRSFGYNAQETAADTLTGTQPSTCSPTSSPTAATCSSTSARTAPATSPTSSSGHSANSVPGSSQRQGHLRDPTLDSYRDHDLRRRPGPVYPREGHHLRHCFVRPPHRPPHIRGLAVPRQQPGASSVESRTWPGPRPPRVCGSRHPRSHRASTRRS